MSKRTNTAYLAGVPTIPGELSNDAAINNLSDADEARMSEAIERATWAIHARRKAREDVKKPVGLREYAKVNIKGGLICMRSMG